MRRRSAPLPKPAGLSKGEATRARLIEAAYRLFLQQGFHGTSMRAIAETAGIAVGGIYNHFATKEDLFAAVLDAYHPYHSILPALEQTQAETVEGFVRAATRQIRAGLEGAETRLMPLIFMEIVEFQGRHMRKLAQKLLPAFYLFFQRFSQQRGRGRLRALPKPIMMRVLMNLMIGHLLTELLLREVPSGLGFKGEVAFNGMIDIYLYGILDDTEVR